MSMESAANYGCLDDPAYMKQFDLEMTYRLRAHIPLPYLRRGHVEDFAKPIVSFENKSARARARARARLRRRRSSPRRSLSQRMRWCISSQTAARAAGVTPSCAPSPSWAWRWRRAGRA